MFYVWKKKNIFILLFLVLFSIPLVSGTTESDFVKISVDGREAYTHKDIVDNRFLLATDKIFYGSNAGQVFMDVFVSDRVSSGQYKIGIETRTKEVTIKSIQINGEERQTIISSRRTSYTYPNLIDVNSGVRIITIELEFDPLEIGLREEIDIILYDSIDRELVRNDPFLSGFGFRQQITLNTSGIGLGGDVTSDETIWINVPTSNTDFWSNHSFTDANGMDFTQSDEVTTLNWDVEGFDATLDDANIWVEYPETFFSATNSILFMYYQGANTDNSDGGAAYPSDYNAVYHSADASGGIVDSTSNAVDMTAVNTPTFGVDGQIDAAVDYQAADNDYQKTSNKFVGTSGSISAWINFDVNTSNGSIFAAADEGGSDFLSFQLSSDSLIEIQNTVSTADTIHGDTNIGVDEWHHVVVTSNGSTYVLYLDGVAETLVVEEGSNNGFWFGDDGGVFDNSTVGAIERSTIITEADGTIDEIKIFTSTLSADEVLLLYNSEINNLVSFGAQETGITLTLNNPNGGENFVAQTIFQIDFNVTVPDSNSFLLDLNLTGANTDVGTGTVVLNDINSLSGAFTCASTDLSVSTNCTYDWNVNNDTGTHYISIKVDDGLGKTNFDASDNNFTISIPSLSLTVFDENSTNTISGAIIDFNSGTYTTDGSGQITIPLTGLPARAFTITVDVNSDYPSRQFIFDLNGGSVDDFNLLMLETIHGASREYKIFQPNQTTLITDSMVEWRRVGTISNGLSQRTRTSGSATLSFFGQQDANYVMRITDNTDSNVVRDYNGTLVTVLIPRNEINTSQLLQPFDLQIGGLAQRTLTDVNANFTFLIYSDTIGFYDIIVDFNSDFFQRTYSVSTKGGQALLEVQPFLLPVDDAVSVTVILTNSNSLVPIKRALVTSRIGTVTLETITTDDGGEGEMSFRIGTPYQLFFTVDGSSISFSPTSEFAIYTAKSGDTQLKIKLNIIDTNVGSTLQVSSSVNFQPGAGVLVVNSPVDLNQTIAIQNSVISQVNTFIIQGSTTISDTNTTTNFISQTLVGDDLGTTNPVIVTTTVTTTSGETFQFTQRYSIQKDFSFITSLINVRNDELGVFGALILALVISLGVMGFAYSAITGFTTDPAPSFALGLIVLGVFTTIGYVPIWLWWISAIGGTAVYIRQRRF